jgi:hypothetical protein
VPERWLIVDDLRTGGDHSYWVDPPVVTVVRTVQEGIVKLSQNEFDILWLDHDLGPDGTIMPLVDWLSERAFQGQPARVQRICVHSANPGAAETMIKTLRRYGYSVDRAMLPC